jgi:hypothetical protein
MPAASRHAKPKSPAIRFGAPIAAAAALAGIAAVLVILQGAAGTARPARHSTPVASTASGVTDDLMISAVHRDIAAHENHLVRRNIAATAAARRKHLAALAAARRAQQAAAQASASASASPSITPSPSPSPAPSLSSGGGNAAASALGVCIRNAEEGGSYAWGPGNGGGAYQFQIGTWEHYGGAASEYGVAGSAYQDQIFDNAIAAGGASNWTAYDGC